MSIVGAYYKDRDEYMLGYRFRRKLHEQSEDAIEAYNDVWQSALEFFTQERDELVDLPPESSERMFVEGVLGILNQYTMDKGQADQITNDDVRANALRVANHLDDVREAASESLRAYVDKLISGMRELHNRIDPDMLGTSSPEEEPSEEPPEEPSPEGEKGGEKGKEGEEEEEEEPSPEEESDVIAKSLGLI